MPQKPHAPEHPSAPTSTREAARLLTHLQLAAAGLGLLTAIVLLFYAALFDPDVPFLTRTDDPQWIAVATAPDANAIQVDLRRVPTVTFEKGFEIDSAPRSATLEARALRSAEYFLNGTRLVDPAPERSWKQTRRFEVGDQLQIGRNILQVAVRNPRGPALLQLRITTESGASQVHTDVTWTAVESDGLKRRAHRTMPATDTRLHQQSISLPSSFEQLRRLAAPLALAFGLSVLIWLALSRTLSDDTRRRTPEITLALATLFWIAVYTTRASQLPVLMGFDIVGHLAYIDFLLREHALPLATDGWSTYHPPLAHLLTSGLAAGVDPARESAAARWLYRLPTFLAGLGNVWVVYFVARRIFRADPLRTSLATGFAAVLPMNVYMSAYVGNEPLHSFLVSLSLLFACRYLLAREGSAADATGAATALGLAIATKFTALLAVPLVAVFVALKVRLVEDRSTGRALLYSGALLGGIAAIGGWVYVRNWWLLGAPVVGNWDLPGNRVWWEQPGFHTLDYYTSFGPVLSQPFFAGFHSFWDGIYSTFWGDGLAAGMIRLATRHEAWNYDFMTVGYWLAFPASLLLIAGTGRALRACLRGDDLRARVAMSLLVALLFALAFALLSITLRLPYYAQAKAFYLLSGIVPLSIFAALGLAWLPERLWQPRWAPLRGIYAGWLGTLALTLVLSFLG